jgi:DNA-binding NtrC family response regulator
MRAKVLVVDDEPRYRALYAQVLTSAGIAVFEAGSAEEALALLASKAPDMVVSDVRMEGASGLDLLKQVRAQSAEMPFLLVTAYADVRDAVLALKLGAVDYLRKPVDLDELLACVQDTLGLRPDQGSEKIPAEVLAEVVAESEAMRALLLEAWRIAQSDANVLLTGESGTGKEVLARFIHRSSRRSAGPLVAVNCAAVPATLLASELFGHEKGAFTGASGRRDGRFREAAGGTLFLDEIGDMPLELQAVLLRAIEQRTVTPLGSSGEVHVDFRLLAATHRPLEEDVAAGRFRKDLYYRLNVIALALPALRERPDDILPLARHFLAKSNEADKRISHAAARALLAYPWPGNTRELANAMERARLMTRTDVILPDNLPPAVRQAAPRASGSMPVVDDNVGAVPTQMQTLAESEMTNIRKALVLTSGNRTKAAELLGVTRRGLLKKLKRLGL